MATLITLTNYLQNIAALLFIIFLLLTPYIFFSVRWRFDPLFRNVGGWKGETHDPLKRAIGYAICLAVPWWAIRNKYIFELYEGYNFRANSTKLQITLSWLFIYCGVFCVVCQLSVMAIRYFLDLPISGMIDLPIS